MTRSDAPTTPNEAAERLRGQLRKVPTHSGAEFREWIANLDEALATERRNTVERIKERIERWGVAELVNPDSSGTTLAYFAADVDAALLDESEAPCE